MSNIQRYQRYQHLLNTIKDMMRSGDLLNTIKDMMRSGDLLNTIKDMMRSGDFQPSILYISMNNIDNYVCDNSPIIDKYLLKYNKFFASK